MPGSRIKYDPGLPGGGRTRYTGPDAYPSQQRENETRAVVAPNGYFFAPVWFNQTPPGGLTNWFANFDTQLPNQTIPAPVVANDHSELATSQWVGATLERFTFTDQSQVFSGWLPVLQPGWWQLNVCTRVEGVGFSFSDVVLHITPTRVLSTGVMREYLRFLTGSAPLTSTVGLSTMSLIVPIAEPCALLVNYEANTAPTLQGDRLQASGTAIEFPSHVSGTRLSAGGSIR